MKVAESKTEVKKAVWDIIVDVSWANISSKYFGKSRSWLSQKMNGRDGNGSNVDFSEEERQTLKNSLFDLSERIRNCAEKI
ncbi:MAG: DUF5053 domain-containing protein [Flavobacteriaceae bacterium]